MASGDITMSERETEKLKVMVRLEAREMRSRQAGEVLGLSQRQIIRLRKRYRQEGAKGLISRQKGKRSHHRISDERRAEIKEWMNVKYPDFGPTFLQEKLKENHGIEVSRETLRQMQIEQGTWKAKVRRKARIHQSRERRSCLGELVQIDGSPHDWFEGRREPCCLLVLVDDATGKLLQLHFEETETSKGYFCAVRKYIQQYGVPIAFYSDKHGVFRINREDMIHEGETQFGRAMKALGVELIHANSPQAKGRVERANGTLQDRLVKELRLRGIHDLETANVYLPEFMERYNARFAVIPKSPVDRHRRLEKSEEELDRIFSFHHERKLSKNLECSYQNQIYQVQVKGQGYTLRHARVWVCEDLKGQVSLLYKGKKLDYKTHEKQKHQTEIVDTKNLNYTVNQLIGKTHKPPPNHPWRKPCLTSSKYASY